MTTLVSMTKRVKMSGVLCEAGGRRTLEPWRKRGCFRRVSDSQNSQKALSAQRSDQTDKEHRQNRKPPLLVCSIPRMGQQECDHRDCDCRDGDPEPGALWAERIHSRCSEYSKNSRQESVPKDQRLGSS